MILILKKSTTHPQAQQLLERLRHMGLRAVKETKGDRIAIAIVSGMDANTEASHFSKLAYVESVEAFSQPFKLAGKDLRNTRHIIEVNGKTIGGDELCVMAGPCSIESEAQIHRIAQSVKGAGAQFLRGGAFKPRTSPYDFQGLGEAGVGYMQSAARENDLVSISEVMDVAQLDILLGRIDIFQVGARNMQNYTLLKALGKTTTPVMLKRGFAATYRELLNAAEYILDAGNPNVILCERGIRTFESYTRNTLDIGAVPALKSLTHLPVIVDPSHGTGIRSMVSPMACGAVAAGADGLMIEVHYEPDASYSDAQQAISTRMFSELMPKLQSIYSLV